jgi:Xaa-Pro dipeptidase
MVSNERLGFSSSEYRRRYDAAMRQVQERDLDALLVRSPENICYLTGYESVGYYGYHGLILSLQEPVLVLRKFEEPNVAETSWLARSVAIEDHHQPVDVVAQTLAELGLASARIGIEKNAWFFTVTEYEALRAALPRANLVDASGLVEACRVLKSPEELDMMRRSAAIVDAAMLAGIEHCRTGTSEDEIAARIHTAAILGGSEYISLPHFVLSGERTSLPHGTWRNRRLKTGDVIFLETSAAKHRYSAALSRTVALGRPTPRLQAMADAVRTALEAALSAIRPGVTSASVDAACRGVIERAGFGQYFRHRTAYSIGVNFPPDWGEGQILSIRANDETPLLPNMTFHVVPLCLAYRELGVGMSATIRVTETGCEEFSRLPHELFIANA